MPLLKRVCGQGSVQLLNTRFNSGAITRMIGQARVGLRSADLLESLVVGHATIAVATSGRPYIHRPELQLPLGTLSALKPTHIRHKTQIARIVQELEASALDL
jgi:hypothetical protein